MDSVIDLLQMKLLKFPANGGKMVVEDIPADQKDKAEEMHNALIEAAAENDEALMDKFFEEGTLSEEDMVKGLKLGIANRGTFPVVCVAARTDQGVDRLMDLVIKNCPSPMEAPAMKATNGNEHKFNAAEPFVGFVFKTAIEQHLGEVSFIKVCDGEIAKAADVMNNNTNTKERISQLLVFAGKNRVEVEKAVAGDIVATIKLKSTPCGTTLVAKGDDIIEPTAYPDPKFRTAVRAKNTADEEKLGAILNEIRKTDPTFLMEQSKELKQMIISGQGEQHLKNKYPTYSVYCAMMDTFQHRFPTLCRVDTILAATPNNHSLFACYVGSNLDGSEQRPQFFYTSTMRGGGDSRQLPLYGYGICRFQKV